MFGDRTNRPVFTRFHTALFTALSLVIGVHSYGADLHGTVTDEQNRPVEEAVLSLTLPDGQSFPPPPTPLVAVMEQRQKQFMPYVLPVRVGTVVQFPNRDPVKHHVYSFSPAKRFELKLYDGNVIQEVLFDTVGMVVLGCNIHDWMVGYVYVVDTPYFVKTDQTGHWRFINLAAGSYDLHLWHPHQRTAVAPRRITVTDAPLPQALQITLKPVVRRTPPPDQPGAYGY